EGLKERKFAPLVRLQYEKSHDPWITKILNDELGINELCIFEMPSLVGYSHLSALYDIVRPQLKYRKPLPKAVTALGPDETNSADIFDAIRKRDHLAHFPFESFHSSVEAFLKAAAHDPKV